MKSQNKIKEYINELNDYLKTYQADHEVNEFSYFYLEMHEIKFKIKFLYLQSIAL